MAGFIHYLNNKQPLDTTNVPAVICCTPEILKSHIENCHKTDTAVLIENDITAIETGDGIYFSEKISISEFKDIRKKYSDISIGVNCETSKHDGINYAEAGADFIVFTGDMDEVETIANWWQEMMEIPVAIFADVNTDTKADFIILATNT